MSAKDIVERLERIRLYAQDLLENGHLFGGAIGNVMAIRDEADAIKARIEADAARIAKLERERDFEQSSRLTSEAQLGTVISNLEVKLARAEALLAERNETGQKPGQQSRTKCTPADEQSGETRPAERATGEAVPVGYFIRNKATGRLLSGYAAYFGEPRPLKDDFGEYDVVPVYNHPGASPHPDEALVKALRLIAHTFTEDSHGNTKTMDASYYQKIAREALSQHGSKP
jgi:hypothetical protein